MTVTQTVEIPADRRITVEVPREIRTGTVILTFTPPQTVKERKFTKEEEKEWYNTNAEWLNKEAMDVLEYQKDIWGDDDK
ncbi:MAG: hypothetical protein FWD47_15545 [Treponema sp.]|nr:hypothetical protein [Treponema sp.]